MSANRRDATIEPTVRKTMREQNDEPWTTKVDYGSKRSNVRSEMVWLPGEKTALAWKAYHEAGDLKK